MAGPNKQNTPSLNPYIDSIIRANRQANPNLTYYFAQQAADSGYAQAPLVRPAGDRNDYYSGALTADEQASFLKVLEMYKSVCNLTFTPFIPSPGRPYADITVSWISFGESSIVGQYDGGGQLRLGDLNKNLSIGSLDLQNTAHELGHWLGLRHPMQPASDFGGVIPSDHAAWDYTSMIYYRSLVGGSNSLTTLLQTLGIDDIRAVQYMYGANFTSNAGDSTYTWNSSGTQYISTGNGPRVAQSSTDPNYIFSSLWDGGGNDTYDLHDFATALKIDLQPGHWSDFGTLYPAGSPRSSIPGNVANAYLYIDPVTGVADLRSLIENAIGGSGDDILIGNQVNNKLTGNAGNDTLDGGLGADTMDGGVGNDTYYIDNAYDVIIEQSSTGGTDTVVSPFSYSLDEVNRKNGSYLENLTLSGSANLDGTGSDVDNVLTGNAGNNHLYGLGGNDTLDGGLGVDTMDGGAGNDTYYVDNALDVIIETTSAGGDAGGNDTVVSTFTYSLDAVSYLENLTLSGSANINGTGSAADNALTGNAGNNDLAGLGGNDTLDGGVGDDTLRGGAGNDVYRFGSGYGTDRIILGVINSSNTWQADGGADLLQFNAGISASDIAWTRNGNDLIGWLIGKADKVIIQDYYLAPGSLTVKLSSGVSVTISPQFGTDNAETMAPAGSGYWIDGRGGNDSLPGSNGSDTIDGGAGNDTMNGGRGSDTYYVDSTSDSIIEDYSNYDTDSVIAWCNYTLPANVKNLRLAGSADFTANGNAEDNKIIGNDGANIIDGVGGIDTMIGGKGNDTYYVDSLYDIVTENRGEGTDTVVAQIDNYSLAAEIENLTLAAGLTILKGTGNGLDNVINGNSSGNSLYGGSGNDVIYGNGGDDTIYGQLGDDTLDGGAGNDTLYGGSGSNIYWIGFDEGNDVINSYTDGTNDAFDRIVLKAGVRAGDVNFRYDQTSNHLIMSLRGTTVEVIRYNAGTPPKQILSRFSVALNDGSLLRIPDNPGTTYTAANEKTKYTSNQRITYGTNGNDTLRGGAKDTIIYGYDGDDTLYGDSGVNQLNGGAGNDKLYGTRQANDPNTLTGGPGDDAYYILTAPGNSYTDNLVEKPGEGYDTVYSDVSFSIQYAANVEKLVLNAGAATYAGGNSEDNLIIGNGNANTIDGSGGADTMQGGAGDDTYHVDNLGDVVDEGAGQGTDTVVSWLPSYSLAAIPAQLRAINSGRFTLVNTSYEHTVEKLILMGTALDGEGNSLDNTIKGNSLDNKLSGLEGDDTINGLGGNDSLNGGVGNDTLDGGFGNDTLDGGAGNDQLIGGDGDDVIFYDAADNPANVLGGAGTDTLVFTSVSAPSTFNLTTHGFEGAEGWYYGANADSWTKRAECYNINWIHTKDVENNRDGSITTTRYDPKSNDDWKTMKVHTDGAGNVLDLTYYYNDRSSTQTTYNQSDTDRSWSSKLVAKDAAQQIDYQTINKTDGTTETTDFDQNNEFDWSQIVTHMDRAHNMDGAQVTYDDGSVVDTIFDWTSNITWRSQSTHKSSAEAQPDYMIQVNDDYTIEVVHYL